MAVQSTYSENIRAAVPAQLVDTIPKTLPSRTVEDAGGLAFGIPVAQGAADKGIRAFTTGDTAAKFIGITVRERSVAAEADQFKQYDSARVLTKGAVWVTASVAVVARDAVYGVPAPRLFSNVDTGNVLIAGARFDTSTTAINQLAQVRLG